MVSFFKKKGHKINYKLWYIDYVKEGWDHHYKDTEIISKQKKGRMHLTDILFM